nr:hypothetical protein BaRGS_030675 [Batillaria attramentaria]
MLEHYEYDSEEPTTAVSSRHQQLLDQVREEQGKRQALESSLESTRLRLNNSSEDQDLLLQLQRMEQDLKESKRRHAQLEEELGQFVAEDRGLELREMSPGTRRRVLLEIDREESFRSVDANLQSSSYEEATSSSEQEGTTTTSSYTVRKTFRSPPVTRRDFSSPPPP